VGAHVGARACGWCVWCGAWPACECVRVQHEWARVWCGCAVGGGEGPGAHASMRAPLERTSHAQHVYACVHAMNQCAPASVPVPHLLPACLWLCMGDCWCPGDELRLRNCLQGFPLLLQPLLLSHWLALSPHTAVRTFSMVNLEFAVLPSLPPSLLWRARGQQPSKGRVRASTTGHFSQDSESKGSVTRENRRKQKAASKAEQMQAQVWKRQNTVHNPHLINHEPRSQVGTPCCRPNQQLATLPAQSAIHHATPALPHITHSPSPRQTRPLPAPNTNRP